MDRGKSFSIYMKVFISKFPYRDLQIPINSNQLTGDFKDLFSGESHYWTMDRDRHYWNTQGHDRFTLKVKMSNPNSYPVLVTLHFNKNSILISALGERNPFIPHELMQEEISLKEPSHEVLSKLKTFFEQANNIEYTRNTRQLVGGNQLS